MTTETLSRIFIPICKVDEEKRLVYGKMTFEAEDAAGEIWDYDGSKPYFEKWSENAEKTSGGKSLGNLRAMHQPIAAGKLTQFILSDEDKSVEIAAKVVDDAEWNKVLEGVYTGFSQGGRYVKRWKDPNDPTKTRYISDPVECSIVDLPCLPGATFEHVKADGSVEIRKFITRETVMDPTNEQIEVRAKELAKAAGDEAKWADHVEAARDDLVAKAAPVVEEPVVEVAPVDGEPREAAIEVEKVEQPEGGEPTGEEEEAPIEDSATEISAEETEKARKAARDRLAQVWKTSDGKTFGKCDEAVTHEATLSVSPPSAVEAALKAARGEEPAEEVAVEKTRFEPTEGLDVAKTVIETFVEKGLYGASRALQVLDSVIDLQHCSAWEEEYEGDGSGVPAALADAARSLGAAALAMCQEEIAEALSDLGGDEVEIDVYLSENEILVENAAATEFVKAVYADEELMKAGARNSKKDADTIQKMHDGAVDLGAKCAMGDEEKALEPDELQKRAERDPVVKHLLDRNVELSAEVEKALAGIGELGEQIKVLKATPAPMAPRTHVIGKNDSPDEMDIAKAENIVAELSKTQDGRRVLTEAAIRASQAAGGHAA
jgi:hypothetical protein